MDALFTRAVRNRTGSALFRRTRMDIPHYSVGDLVCRRLAIILRLIKAKLFAAILCLTDESYIRSLHHSKT